jgi:hypothetical protein
VGLIDDLKPGPVALDTQMFIYFIEEDKRYLPLVKPLFEAIDQGSLLNSSIGSLDHPIRPCEHSLRNR